MREKCDGELESGLHGVRGAVQEGFLRRRLERRPGGSSEGAAHAQCEGRALGPAPLRRGQGRGPGPGTGWVVRNRFPSSGPAAQGEKVGLPPAETGKGCQSRVAPACNSAQVAPPRELAPATRFTPEHPRLSSGPSASGIRVCPRGCGCCAPTPARLHPHVPGLVSREHHDRVLHDWADARLRRGLLHLQPHPRRPRQLLLRPHHQRLFPCRPVSQPCPERPLGPTPGPEA